MSAKTLYRASGLALVLGAVLGILGNVLSSVFFPGNTSSQPSMALQVLTLLGLLGNALSVIGLPGLAARQVSRAGWLGFVGFVLTLLGGFILTCLTFSFFTILPELAQVAPKVAATFSPPALFVSFLVASILLVLGGVMLGVSIMRTGIWPRWTGIALIVGAILNFADFFLGSGGSGALLDTIFSIGSFLLFAVAIGWIGADLMRTSTGEEATQLATASAQATI
ncbi:MAG TPA: hypothetical protein VGD98_03605 [Ktedonobacteraceae bacterium]